LPGLRRAPERLALPDRVAAGDPAALLLRQPQRGQQGGLLRRVARADLLQPLQRLAGEDGRVFLRLDCAHRSTSPITMSTDALIAIKSLRRCPAAIFGSDDRLMNDGGRMRHRTGFAEPSDTR